MGNYVDLTGRRFGRLTVIERAPDKLDNRGNSLVMWRCQCDCGRTSSVWSHSLMSGNTKSCGCRKRETLCEATKKHGCTGERLYRVWQDMIRRCENPTDNRFQYYGGRGIAVCKEWRHDYLAFKDFAMRNGYDENAKRGDCTIDRIDVNGDYSPENCRFVSNDVQSNNKTNCIFIEYKGKRQNVSQWAKETGMKRETIRWRQKQGWTTEEIFETPVRK